MSKEHLLNLLYRVYVQEISADEAFDELEDLIDRIKRLEEAGDEIEMILLGYASRVELPKTMAIEQSDLSKRLCVNWRRAKEAKL